MAYLKGFTDYEQVLHKIPPRSTFDLGRLERLLSRLGSPHHGMPIVHITGTKGKTSTTWMTETILRSQGLKTFRFTSPHVETIHERLAIGGVPVTDEQFAALVNSLRPEVDRILVETPEDTPSFFEMMTVMGFLLARNENVDVLVLEVGLGGRLDATNVVDPTISIITSIALDHERILGSTLPAIAAEKAGIIKQRRPVIVGLTDDHEGLPTILDKAAHMNAPVLQRGDAFEVTRTDQASTWREGPALSGEIRLQREWWEGLSLRAGAPHQLENAAMALLASQRILEETGRPVDMSAAFRALAELTIPARAEWFPGHPPVLLDGAHTEASLKSLMRLVENLEVPGPLTLLMGLTRDRVGKGLIEVTQSCASHTLLSPLPSSRSWNPEDGVALCPDRAEKVDSPQKGLEQALETTPPDGLVVVCGSLYLAGAIRPYLRQRNEFRT